MRLKNIIFALLAMLFVSSLFAQQRLNKKDAFIYFMKIYDYKMKDWYNPYVKSFHASELAHVNNDEFKRRAFVERTNAEMRNKLKSLSFETTYTLNVKADLGKYNFSDGSFPLVLKVEDIPSVAIVKNVRSLFVQIDQFVNADDLELKLPVNQTSAQSFINSRKKSNGYVDRSVKSYPSF